MALTEVSRTAADLNVAGLPCAWAIAPLDWKLGGWFLALRDLFDQYFLTSKIVFLFYFLAIYKDAVADLCRGNVRGFQILEPSGCSRGLKRVPGVPSISLPYISVIFPFSSCVPEGSKSKWFQEPFGPEGSRHPLCSSEGTMRPWNPL